LKKKAEPDREKIKAAVERDSVARREEGAHERREKTKRRSDQELAVHRAQLF
jgi:hypothetical protein